jgi:putative ubiquitin-RnfH superfamily antitoxin RatB of RatAB toxin-antitoxin module
MAPAPEDRTAGILRVAVAWAPPGELLEVVLELPAGATVGDALENSGLLERARRAQGMEPAFGVFNRLRPATWPLHDGDRIEIYRPLLVDPKEARKIRAANRTGKRPV